MKLRIAAAALLAASLAAGPAFAANIISNGSFESGMTGWTPAGGACVWLDRTVGQSSGGSGNFTAPAPTQGSSLLMSDATAPGVCTFHQDVALPAGNIVTVSADAGANFQDFGGGGAGCDVTFAVTTTGGAPIATVYNAPSGAVQALAPRGPVNITASAGTTVRIIATTTSCAGGPAGIVLDNVVVDAAPAATIPTMGEWAMIGLGALLAGLGGLFATRRRYLAS